MALKHLGIKPLEFGKLTPGEFYDMLEGYTEKEELRQKEIILSNHMLLKCLFEKKLPDIGKIIKIEPQKINREEELNDFENMKKEMGS